jgi:ppGpp synthetase/RelA/SpoT-type nucleotidyltranferase
MKPTVFGVADYAKWHETARRKDRPLLRKLEKWRAAATTEAKPDLELLLPLLDYVFTYVANESKRITGQNPTYETPLRAALQPEAPDPLYDNLFKAVPSIVNKMWRKSTDDGPTVTLDNLRTTITDLIRTDVRTETLHNARFLATCLNSLPDLIYDADLKARYAHRVERVAFEPEMKMAAGYFAYHGLVHFRSGYVVEVQIYSALMSEWRKLSHLLYERVRLEPIARHEYGSAESRVISLGHLLHLAECEIERLAQEIERP